MIISWLENMILLMTGLLDNPVSETLGAYRAVPVCTQQWITVRHDAPPGKKVRVSVSSVLCLWQSVKQ